MTVCPKRVVAYCLALCHSTIPPSLLSPLSTFLWPAPVYLFQLSNSRKDISTTRARFGFFLFRLFWPDSDFVRAIFLHLHTLPPSNSHITKHVPLLGPQQAQALVGRGTRWIRHSTWRQRRCLAALNRRSVRRLLPKSGQCNYTEHGRGERRW